MNSAIDTVRINMLWSQFVLQIKNSGAISYTDMNRESQNILARLFKVIFQMPGLRNLDTTERNNYPGIDLADDNARVAFQITSTITSSKIKDALKKFARHKHYTKYDRLIHYILTDKQPNYDANFTGIVPSPFVFDKARDILDHTDIFPHIKALEPHQQKEVLDILEDEFGNGSVRDFVVSQEEIDKHKQVYSSPAQFDLAMTTLRERGIVILSGPPHIGKSETGTELLLRAGDERNYGRVLRFRQISDWNRLLRIKNEAILLDDAFGASKYADDSSADRFDELRLLGRTNLVVITSRHGVLSEARRQGRIGEEGALDELIIEFTQEGAYTNDVLHKILQDHARYAVSSATPEAERISSEQEQILLENWEYIVQELRFPHNINQLVSKCAANLNQKRDLRDLIGTAKDIKRAVNQWYSKQGRPVKVFCAIIALFPDNPHAEVQNFYRTVCSLLVHQRRC